MSTLKSLFSNKQTSNSNSSNTTINSLSSKFSQEELFDVIYPKLYNIPLPVSEFAPIYYKYPTFYMDNYILQHFPAHSFTKAPNPDCIPMHTYKTIIQDLLYPYGIPEIRKFDSNTNLPLNFDPENEVYLTWFKLNSFVLKPDKQLPCLFINKCNLENSYLHNNIWLKSSSLLDSSITAMMPQPAFELFMSSYNVEYDRGVYAFVFKAKRGLPEEFKEYWNTQTPDNFLNDYSYFENHGIIKYNLTLDTQYPLIKMFYSFYLMRAYINIVENPKLRLSLIKYSEALSNKQSGSLLTPGNMVYVNKFNFGLLIGENTIYLDNDMFMTVDHSNITNSFPSELSTHVHFTPAISDASQSTPVKAELLIISNADSTPILRLLKGKLSEKYDLFQKSSHKESLET